MPQSFFIWNGIDCRAMGVIMRGPAAIIRPEERVKHTEIPGVSGDLTETEGKHVYNSYIQTITISVKNRMNVRNIYKWLRGSGYVTFSGEPDRKQAARVIGAITLNRVSRNIDHWAGEVQFYCQPLKQLLHETTVTITSTGVNLRNNGDVECYPLMKVTPNMSSIVFQVGNDEILIVNELTSGSDIWIDSETMEVWNATHTALLTKNSTGKFPVLQPGDNTITAAGFSSAEIGKRERYL